jgi:hypothetical protein
MDLGFELLERQRLHRFEIGKRQLDVSFFRPRRGGRKRSIFAGVLIFR